RRALLSACAKTEWRSARRAAAGGAACRSRSAKRSLPRAAGLRYSSRLFYFAGRRIEARLGLRRPGGLRDAVAHGGHLGEDRHRDLRRRLRADVQAHRPAQARDLLGGDVELLEPLTARVVVFLRADGADI